MTITTVVHTTTTTVIVAELLEGVLVENYSIAAVVTSSEHSSTGVPEDTTQMSLTRRGRNW